MLRQALFALPLTLHARAHRAWKVLLRFACMNIRNTDCSFAEAPQQLGRCQPGRDYVASAAALQSIYS